MQWNEEEKQSDQSVYDSLYSLLFPLENAIASGNTGMKETIKERMHSLFETYPHIINIVDPRSGITLLTFSIIMRFHPELVEFLLKEGAEPNVLEAHTRARGTPLYTAVEYTNLPIIRLLLHYGADPELPSRNGETALDMAGRLNRAGKEEIIALLSSPLHLERNKNKGRTQHQLDQEQKVSWNNMKGQKNQKRQGGRRRTKGRKGRKTQKKK